MPMHINTPLLRSAAMSKALGSNVWLKMDALQPPGSFKIRGIGLACEEYARRGVRRFISSSGGNAGIAVAYAGRQLGIPVTVVVPTSTTSRARELIVQEGAELLVHGASWQETNQHAQTLCSSHDAFIHPFDNPLLWQGHASLVDEVVASGLRPDVVIVSVGGGGLYCGVVAGLVRNDLAHVPVIAVETEGAASMRLAISAGTLAELPQITSVATSLGAKQIAEQAFNYTSSHPTKSVVVSDQMAVQACVRFLEDHRVLVEPACGAALSTGYFAVPELHGYTNVLCVVCGGIGTTPSYLAELAARYAH